jgi:hypothetical protein
VGVQSPARPAQPPTTDSSDKSLPGPADTDTTNPTPRSAWHRETLIGHSAVRRLRNIYGTRLGHCRFRYSSWTSCGGLLFDY